MRRRIKMLLWLVATIAVLLSGGPWGRAARASIFLYTDALSFFQAATVVSTETFDEFPSRTILGLGSVTIDGITYASPDASVPWQTSDSFSFIPSPPNSLIQNSRRAVETTATLTFGAGAHTDAIGFFLLPGIFVPGGNYRFDVVTALGATLSVSSGVTGEPIFRGFVVTPDTIDGIEQLAITPLSVAGSISNFALDNVSRGVITSTAPEPPALWLALTGIPALLFTFYRPTRRGRI